MADVGVGRDAAERVLGHALSGIEAVYDRSEHYDQKVDALDRLARRIDEIVDPPPEDRKVVHLPSRAGA
jgi:hypothetical protein